MSVKWIAYRFEMDAEIGDYKFPHVVQYTSSFTLGGIPTASIVVPVGRSVSTGTAATIHKAWKKLRIRQKAKVWLRMVLLSNSGGVKPENMSSRRLIFDGYAVGVGFRRSQGGAQVSISLEHWLSDLNYTSAISGTSHPSNPSDYTYPAIFGDIDPAGKGGGQTGVGSGLPTWVTDFGGKIAPSDVQEDLWAKVLSPWMRVISEQDLFDTEINPTGDGKNNQPALDALKRMKSVKMGMDIECEDSTAIAEGMQDALCEETWSSWVSTTLWGKIIGEWCPSYWFTIVPRVDDCLVVPLGMGLRKTFITIKSDEYQFCEMTAQLQQVLGNLGILHPTSSQTGIKTTDDDSDESGLLTIWPKSTENNGVKLYKNAPRWLSEVMFDYSEAKDTTGADEEGKTGTVLGKPLPAGAAKKNRGKIKKAITTVMQRFAHQWYLVESLKGRYGELSGKLRFDIAPGSSVKIEGVAEQFVGDDTLGEAIYATVLTVTELINTEEQKAATSFALVHLRNEDENRDERYSIDSPPLYSSAWVGDKLVV